MRAQAVLCCHHAQLEMQLAHGAAEAWCLLSSFHWSTWHCGMHNRSQTWPNLHAALHGMPPFAAMIGRKFEQELSKHVLAPVHLADLLFVAFY